MKTTTLFISLVMLAVAFANTPAAVALLMVKAGVGATLLCTLNLLLKLVAENIVTKRRKPYKPDGEGEVYVAHKGS